MSLGTVTVTGDLTDASLAPVTGGQVIFTPSTGSYDAAGNPVITSITDSTDKIVIPMTGVVVPLNRGQFSQALVPTNAAGLQPAGWMYQVTIDLPGIPAYSFLCFIPSTTNPVDLSQLIPVTTSPVTYFLTDLDGGTATSGLLPTGNIDGGKP